MAHSGRGDAVAVAVRLTVEVSDRDGVSDRLGVSDLLGVRVGDRVTLTVGLEVALGTDCVALPLGVTEPVTLALEETEAVILTDALTLLLRLTPGGNHA